MTNVILSLCYQPGLARVDHFRRPRGVSSALVSTARTTLTSLLLLTCRHLPLEQRFRYLFGMTGCAFGYTELGDTGKRTPPGLSCQANSNKYHLRFGSLFLFARLVRDNDEANFDMDTNIWISAGDEHFSPNPLFSEPFLASCLFLRSPASSNEA